MPQAVHRIANHACYRCGRGGDQPDKCRFKQAKCLSCGKVGHIQRVCRTVPKPDKTTPKKSRDHRPQPIKQLSGKKEEPIELFLNHFGEDNNAIQLTVYIEGNPALMELDTGASVSILSSSTWTRLFPGRELKRTNTVLKTFSGEQLQPIGSADVKVQYKSQSVILPILVLEGEGPDLFGRNWLKHIRIEWQSMHQVEEDKLHTMWARHKKIFQEGLGKVKDFKAKIHVKADATPKFCKARPVPYSMKVKIEEELDSLLSLGILKPVQFSEWAMPIVPVLKPDRSVRICGDFKVTVNPVTKLDRYPIEDLLATLGGGKSFTKLDMSQAYQQVELEESSKKYTVINTHKGLFEYTRLPFGISSAPGIFQRVMEGLLQNIPVVVYIDDVLITGTTDEDHLQSLETVLKGMEDAGMLLKKDKCCFMTKSVSYLGYIIAAEGLHPTKEKLQAIRDAPSPKNLTQLKSYLGLLSYYGRFLPNLSNVLFPLYRLLRRQTPWTWSKTEEETFQNSKKLLMSSKLLVHFDPSLELILACDASNYGIGAVLALRLPDRSEKPIGFASRTLSETEKRYSQLEKEGLACIFGIKKFHSYLFGHPFTIYTDN